MDAGPDGGWITGQILRSRQRVCLTLKWSERTPLGFSRASALGIVGAKCALKVPSETRGHRLIVYPTHCVKTSGATRDANRSRPRPREGLLVGVWSWNLSLCSVRIAPA